MSRDGPAILESSKLGMPNVDLLENVDVRSPAAAGRESVRGVVGLKDPVELAAEDEAAGNDEEEGESEENTDPNTRLAFSREASFLSSIRIRDGFLGFVGVGALEGRKERSLPDNEVYVSSVVVVVWVDRADQEVWQVAKSRRGGFRREYSRRSLWDYSMLSEEYLSC